LSFDTVYFDLLAALPAAEAPSVAFSMEVRGGSHGGGVERSAANRLTPPARKRRVAKTGPAAILKVAPLRKF
jgi:hypothetical protein